MKINFLDAKRSYKIDFIFDKLQKQEIGIVAGLGAAGKSLFILDILLDYFIDKIDKENQIPGLNNGLLHLESKKCLFITTEDTEKSILNRINRKLKLKFNDLETLEVNKILEELNDVFYLEYADNAIESKKIIEKYQDYDLLILDTLSVIAELENENDNAEVAKKIQYFKELGKKRDIAILFIHHLSQSGFKIKEEDDISGDLVRGATTLINNCRYASILAKTDENLCFKNIKVNSAKMETIKMEKEYWENGFRIYKGGKDGLLR